MLLVEKNWEGVMVDCNVCQKRIAIRIMLKVLTITTVVARDGMVARDGDVVSGSLTNG